MDYSKLQRIIDIISKICSILSNLFGKKNNKTKTELEQDEQTNTDTLNKLNKELKEKLK